LLKEISSVKSTGDGNNGGDNNSQKTRNDVTFIGRLNALDYTKLRG